MVALISYLKTYFLTLVIVTFCFSCVGTLEETVTAGTETGAGKVIEPGGNPYTAGEMTAGTGAGEMTAGTSMITRPDRLTCNVGDPLDLCIACGPNNTEVTATNDERCEMIDCELLTKYRQVRDEAGLIECRRQDFLPGPSICQGPGACYTEPLLYCEAQTEMTVISNDEITPCFTLEGCSDEREPELVPQPGELCHDGLGMCDEEGTCVVMRSCLTLFPYDYNPNNQLCNDRLATQGYCDFYIKAGQNPWGTEEVSCEQF